MDTGLALLPFTAVKRTFADVTSIATLDFALRFMRPPNMLEWSIHEQVLDAGTGERHYCVGRLFDRTGGLVACMTETVLVRFKPIASENQQPSKDERAKL